MNGLFLAQEIKFIWTASLPIDIDSYMCYIIAAQSKKLLSRRNCNE